MIVSQKWTCLSLMHWPKLPLSMSAKSDQLLCVNCLKCNSCCFEAWSIWFLFSLSDNHNHVCCLRARTSGMFSISQSDKNHNAQQWGKKGVLYWEELFLEKLGCTSLCVSPVYLCQASIYPKDANVGVLVNDLLIDWFFAHLNLEFLQCFVNEGHLFWMVWLCYGLAMCF